MNLESVRALVPIADAELVPPPSLFAHQSTLHGQAHVARVMVHAFRLVEATGFSEEMPRLWAAVYLHDIARTTGNATGTAPMRVSGWPRSPRSARCSRAPA